MNLQLYIITVYVYTHYIIHIVQ